MEVHSGVPVQPPGARDVLVRVAAVGLCGTDFHIYLGHGNYNTDARGRAVPLEIEPQILGHEIVGRVEECGNAVRDLRPGDCVVLDQGICCVSAARQPLCEYCATGDSHQCVSYREHGITGLPGGLAEFITVPATNAVRVATSLPIECAALTEPLGCIVHASTAVSRVNARFSVQAVEPERRVRGVLISGAGPAGLLFTQFLRRVLGYEGLLIVAEPVAAKRALAERFGATAIDPRVPDLIEAVHELTGGQRLEYVIDASGAGALYRQLPGLLRKQGTLLMYGHGHAGEGLSVLNNVQFLEPTLVSPVGASGAYVDGKPATYQRALSLIESGAIEVAPLVTHLYDSLEAVPGAFEDESRQQPDYVKGVVRLAG
jgi:L-iditol 2-dehydrogenase